MHAIFRLFSTFLRLGKFLATSPRLKGETEERALGVMEEGNERRERDTKRRRLTISKRHKEERENREGRERESGAKERREKCYFEREGRVTRKRDNSSERMSK